MDLRGVSSIGVKEIFTNPISKSDFLLFDKIAIPLFSAIHEHNPKLRAQQDFSAIDRLFEGGLLLDVDFREQERYFSAQSSVGPGMQLSLAMWAAAVGIVHANYQVDGEFGTKGYP